MALRFPPARTQVHRDALPQKQHLIPAKITLTPPVVLPRLHIRNIQRAIGNQGVLRHGTDIATNRGRILANSHTSDNTSSNTRGAFMTPSVRQTISGNGKPLETAIRHEAEQRFNHDFSSVRIHDGVNASQSTNDIGAAAYTHGNNIVFAPGLYRPQTTSGKRLLAHELAHVVQQRRGGTEPPNPARNSFLEQSADRAASMFTRGRGRINVQGSAAPGVSRTPRSLSVCLEPSMLRDDELATEIREIQRWLLVNISPSSDRTYLLKALADLQAESQRRPTIATRGTVEHTGTIGRGSSRGTIEARTNESINIGGGTMSNLLAISYSGANARNARWLQFVWFEMNVASPAGTTAVSGTIPTTSGTKPFTTNSASPNWSVDSANGVSPFYIYGGGVGIRDASTQTLFDRPGGASAAPLFQAALSGVAGATAATVTAHFSTYLIINDAVRYHVPWTAATTATVSGSTATIANVAYTVGSAGAASSLPANLRAIFHTNYPHYTAIR